VSAIVDSPTTVSVTWGIVPPIDQNGIIIAYEVLYQPLETFGGGVRPQIANVSAPNTSVTMTDLEEFLNYTIMIRAYTIVGAGNYSEGMTIMTLEDSMSS